MRSSCVVSRAIGHFESYNWMSHMGRQHIDTNGLAEFAMGNRDKLVHQKLQLMVLSHLRVPQNLQHPTLSTGDHVTTSYRCMCVCLELRYLLSLFWQVNLI